MVHPNGHKLYAGDSRKINVLDAKAHFLRSIPHGFTGEHAITFAFTPDRRYLYVGGVRGYDVFDTVTDTFTERGSVAAQDEMIAFSPPPNPVTCLAISPNNKYLFTCGSRLHPAIKIIDFKTGTILASFPTGGACGQIYEACGIALVTARG